MAKASASTKAFETRAQAMGTRMQTVGGGISRVGSTMSRAVTLPLVAAGAVAVKTAVDFESAFAGVRKTVDATEPQFRALERGIMQMAERLPASVEEISAVAEAAGQLGITRPNILGFTKTMIDLGETTDLSADQAATALARISNVMQTPQKNIDRLGSTLVGLGNAGASTESEIAQMAMRIAGAGRQVNMTEGEVLGFANALSSVGIEAQAGGSSISRVMIDMASAVEDGGQKLQDFATVAGVAPAQFATAFRDDAAGAIITFVEGLGKIRKEGGDVFGTLEKLGLSEIRVRDALLRASGAGDLFRESLALGNKTWRENTALTEEANKRYKTNAARFEMVKNQVRNAAARIGEDLLPIIKDTVDVISDLTESFSNLDPGLRKNIIKWGLLAIAMGPVLRIVGGIVSLGGTAVGVLTKIAGAGAAAAAAPSVGAAAGGAVSGFGSKGLLSGTQAVAGKGVAGAAGGAAAGGLAGLALGAVAIAAALVAKQAADEKQALDDARAAVDKYGVGHEEAAEGVSKLETAQSRMEHAGKGAGTVLARGNTLLEEATKRHRSVMQGMLDTARAEDAYGIATARATNLTTKQRERVAGLIGGFVRLTGGIDRTTVSQVNNLLALGDVGGAIQALKGRLDEATGGLNRHAGGHHRARAAISSTGASAENAKLKVSGLNRELSQIPRTKTVDIFVQTHTFGGKLLPGAQGGGLGSRQHGGPASAGQAYVVGETGPEILMMGRQSGYIEPTGRKFRSAHEGGGVGGADLEEAIVRAMRRVGNVGPMEVRDNLFMGIEDFEKRTEETRRRRQILLGARPS